MDIELFGRGGGLQDLMPEFNQDILNGLACKDLMYAKESLDQTIRCAQQMYPPGFEFDQSTVCSPMETYAVIAKTLTRSKRSKQMAFDLARTNVYLVKYQFTFEGRPLYPRYFYLPYADLAGLMNITGKKFLISPVMTDTCFSIGPDFVFIPMGRAPVTFRRESKTIYTGDLTQYAFHSGGVTMGEESYSQLTKRVVWSWLHHAGGKNARASDSEVINLGKVFTTLPHYLFARYGFVGAFARFAHAEAKVVPEADILEGKYPAEQWQHYWSTKTKPTYLKFKADYRAIATKMAVVVPKAQVNNLVEQLVAGFFYVLDHFPEPAKGDDIAEEVSDLEGDYRWKVWLGNVLWGEMLGHGKLVENVETHLNSLYGYVDIEVRQKLLVEEGLDCESIYDLFVHMLDNMENMIKNNADTISSLYGKRLEVLRYILKDLNKAVFKCLFEITNNRKRQMRHEDYDKILGQHFKPATIFGIRHPQHHGEVSSASSPADNMFFKLTSKFVMQSETSGRRKNSDINPNDPSTYLDASLGEVGNYAVLPKNRPLGDSYANPTVQLDGKHTIIRKEQYRELTERTQEEIRRR